MSLADRGDGLADGMAVFHHRVAATDIVQGHFMADRDGVQRRDLDRLVRFHNPTGHFRIGLDGFHDNDTDGVGLVMDHEMGGSHSSSGFLLAML